MPPELDEEQDLPSSEQADLDEGAAKADATDAASSPAADAEPERDTLAIVRDVTAKAADPAPAAPGSSPEGEEAGAAPAEKQPDDENFTDVPFHKHPRFQHLLREHKAAKLDATRYRNVEAFLERQNLTPDEAADAMELVGLAKTDPVKAWERLKPFAEQVALAAGVLLPPDIQQQVQAGRLTREAAAEIAKARAIANAAGTREQLRQQQEQQRAEQAAQQALVSSASLWEADRRVKDPNFDAKLPLLQREIAYLHATEGRPKAPEGVKDQLERAYKAVNAAYRPPQPAAPVARPKAAVRPVTGGQVAGNPAAEAKTTLDIIRAHRRSG